MKDMMMENEHEMPEMDDEMQMKADLLDELMNVIDEFRAGRMKKPEEQESKVEIELG